MGGDYSRERFDPLRDFSGVRMQQGRVQLDADWNEQVAIADRRWRAETRDIVGRCVVPLATPDGFRILLEAGQLVILAGRIYVDGLLAENHGRDSFAFDPILVEVCAAQPGILYEQQPYFPPAAPLIESLRMPTDGTHLVYIDVWQRELTFLEAPDLVEPAIGIDTTTRMQTAWQVKLLRLADNATSCDTPDESLPEWLSLIAPSAGRLTTSIEPVPSEAGPCVLPPSAGYRGLENRLYRVEIHDGEGLLGATFKWSRDNASVTAAVTALVANQTLTVDQTGRDAELRFEAGDWIEITDDVRELSGGPGWLAKIDAVDPTARTIKLAMALPTNNGFATDAATLRARHTRIRRWDQQGPDADSNGGVLKIPPSGTVVLEDGIQVTFSTEPTGGKFRVGDYWVFTARTADRSVESLKLAPPRGVHHHYGRLAVVTLPSAVSDCRVFWPPNQLTYVSGDGQESDGDQELCGPLEVRLTNAHGAVRNSEVTFRILAGPNGRLIGTNSAGTPTEAVAINVLTDATGLATCRWRLASDIDCQRVEASSGAAAKTPIRFNARRRNPIGRGSLVKGITLINDNQNLLPLRNDSLVTFAQLLRGIRIVTTARIDASSLKRPICFVTIEDPTFIGRNYDMGGAPAGYLSLVLAAQVGIGKSPDGTDIPNCIDWIPAENVRVLLDRVRNFQNSQQVNEPILARLTVKGSFIWGAEVPNNRLTYLDGDTFGRPLTPNRLSPAGRPQTDLVLPTGDGQGGGDLEMWFWLRESSLIINPQSFISFGTLGINIDSPRTVTLTNFGETPIRAEVSVSGPAFRTTLTNPALTIGPGGQQVNIPIVFRAPMIGAFAGELQIKHELAANTPVRIALSGQGGAL